MAGYVVLRFPCAWGKSLLPALLSKVSKDVVVCEDIANVRALHWYVSIARVLSVTAFCLGSGYWVLYSEPSSPQQDFCGRIILRESWVLFLSSRDASVPGWAKQKVVAIGFNACFGRTWEKSFLW